MRTCIKDYGTSNRQLREKDVKSIDEVEYAILENNGRLSVFTYKDKDNETFPLPLIISGKIEKDNLKLIDNSEIV